ncbi:MAG: thiamine phosphate synthase [Nitrospirae bacterium]|nr:thiamine phosphate synthase [Nitrospirota bacterium]
MIDFRLYLITDRRLIADSYSLMAAVEEALKGGVRAVQLREKDLGTRELLGMAYKMRELTGRYKAKLFINDRADIAIAIDADGVHLGQKSMPAYAVRKIVHNNFLIGVSTHSIQEAKKAEEEGADFVTLGPIYQTPSKLKYGEPVGINTIRRVKAEISIPVFAIGGIKENRVKEVINVGADGVALISGILSANDICEKTKEFLRMR